MHCELLRSQDTIRHVNLLNMFCLKLTISSLHLNNAQWLFELVAVRVSLKNYEVMKTLLDRWIDLAAELSNLRLANKRSLPNGEVGTVQQRHSPDIWNDKPRLGGRCQGS